MSLQTQADAACTSQHQVLNGLTYSNYHPKSNATSADTLQQSNNFGVLFVACEEALQNVNNPWPN